MRQHEKAIAEGERAVALNPNGAFDHGLLGMTLGYAGRLDEAIDHLKQGIRLNPFPEYWYFYQLARCYLMKGQYEKALGESKKPFIAVQMLCLSIFNWPPFMFAWTGKMTLALQQRKS
jgi:tetratricopeptide (TPR) repeat protein